MDLKAYACYFSRQICLISMKMKAIRVSRYKLCKNLVSSVKKRAQNIYRNEFLLMAVIALTNTHRTVKLVALVVFHAVVVRGFFANRADHSRFVCRSISGA